MSEILKRLQESMEKKKKKPPKKEIKPEISTPPKVEREKIEGKLELKKISLTKRNVQFNKSQLLKLLNTANISELTPKQKRALKTLGTAEPEDKSDRKLVTLWDQKKNTIASLELLLSIFMQQPIEINFKT